MSALPFRWLAPAVAAVSALSFACGQQPASTPSPVPLVATANPAPDPLTAIVPTEPKSVWSSVHIHQPYVALTFDDGPHFALTPRLLDTLKAKGVHATFFVIGQHAKEYPAILKRIIAEGHEIGNHSWSHPNLAKMGDDAVKSELNRTSDAIEAAIGKRPTLMRPPYGSFTKSQGKWFHDDLGFTVVLWDVDPDDWRDPGPAVVEDRVLNGWKDSPGVRPGSIVLSHDIHKGTVEAEPDIIDKLIAKEYKFVTVSELIAMNQPEPPKPGKAKVGPGTAAATVDHPAHPATKAAPTPVLPDKITGAPGQ